MCERMMHLKECLLCCIEAQMECLEDVDTAELGEAIDMLKDLEEAMYYNTVTEAMKGDGEEKIEWGGKTHYYSTLMTDGGDENMMIHSPHEGRSPMSRKMYMEAKTMHSSDKAMQLRELEKYMQELTNDVVEMIQDSSPEEKSYLEKKMTTLATKIGQMK